jgi:hypothetical protein
MITGMRLKSILSKLLKSPFLRIIYKSPNFIQGIQLLLDNELGVVTATKHRSYDERFSVGLDMTLFCYGCSSTSISSMAARTAIVARCSASFLMKSDSNLLFENVYCFFFEDSGSEVASSPSLGQEVCVPLGRIAIVIYGPVNSGSSSCSCSDSSSSCESRSPLCRCLAFLRRSALCALFLRLRSVCSPSSPGFQSPQATKVPCGILAFVRNAKSRSPKLLSKLKMLVTFSFGQAE